jgi:hypothetical protein
MRCPAAGPSGHRVLLRGEDDSEKGDILLFRSNGSQHVKITRRKAECPPLSTRPTGSDKDSRTRAVTPLSEPTVTGSAIHCLGTEENREKFSDYFDFDGRVR